MGGTRAIGSMPSMMGMELRAGLEVVDTRVNIDKDRGMVMGFIDFTLGTLTLGSGVMGRVMVWEYRRARMVAVMLVNSSMELSMDLGATILEMEIDMQASILETKSMDLVSITLLMVIVMKGHGMKAASKLSEQFRLLGEQHRTLLTTGGVAAVKAVQNRMDGKFCDTNV
ncbi:hypothetical protein M0R45_011272 [Rubus argutus]|uniref:Uncharacterized protein n=1 Tax=Rubus argutus TaxID=59490 RepID=A0AAW1Y9M9_RUBAR